jgi:hypothetical protein
MAKIGERFVEEMIDRGRREAASVLFTDSNIAQPLYPLRGGYEVSKEPAPPSLGDRLKQIEIGREDYERDDRDQGIDREI